MQGIFLSCHSRPVAQSTPTATSFSVGIASIKLIFKKGNGPVTLWVSKSVDNGVTWTRTIFGKSGAPIPCRPYGFSYLSAQDAITFGSDDTIYLLWNSSINVTNFAPERIYFAKSTDGGRTYSTRVDVSDAPAGVEHCFPALTVGQTAGYVRIGWMDL